MQGLGRRIVSFESHGFRLVAIGNEVRWSKGWRTFHDFLLDYIKAALTPEWGTAELAKPEGEQHPLMTWFGRVGVFLQAPAKARQGDINTAQMTGVVRAYLGLAYDLYLSAHNAELPELLMKRLRNRKTFEGVLYEAFVIGCFAKAGYEMEFEDEGDSTVSHCEFTATHKTTGRKFSVEAKAVTSASGRAGAGGQPLRIRGKLYDALRKKAEHERIIFIELNRTQTLNATGEPDWAASIDAEIAAAEREFTIAGKPAPPAYVLITNRAFMRAHAQIPSTFDDRTPKKHSRLSGSRRFGLAKPISCRTAAAARFRACWRTRWSWRTSERHTAPIDWRMGSGCTTRRR